MKALRPRTGLVVVLAVFLCILASAARAQQFDLKTPLPVDPAVKVYNLENGMTVWIRHHRTPPGRVGIWLHVGSGSLNEEEDQCGLAHFIEHMAFRGSENFPPGTLVQYFESIGLTFGHDQNAFTGFDQTTYQLTLPNTREETLDKGLLCMADFAFGLTFPADAIEKERGVILEEMLARKSAGQRLTERLLPIILPGSRAAERLPIGKEKVVREVGREDFLRYYRERYRPDEATLLIVGDVDPERTAEMVRRRFAPWPRPKDAPQARDPGIQVYTASRAAVATDPEQTTADVEVVSVQPLEKLLTVGDMRRSVVEGTALWIVNRRLQRMVEQGTAPFQSARLEKTPLFNVCTYVQAEATGQPDAWRPMLESLLTEVKRARDYGFLPEEMEDARKAALASAEQAARTESTRDARALLGQMNALISQRRKPISAAQSLELLRQLLPTLEVQEVTDAFRKLFDPQARLLLAVMPEKEGLPVPAEGDLLAAAERAGQADVAAPKAQQRPRTLLKKEPSPGRVIEQEEDPDLGVLSVTMRNGARAHLRSMDFKKDLVLVNITLAGGPLLETGGRRGLTQTAALAFRQPATGTLSSTDIRDLLTGKNVRLSGGISADAMVITVSGTPDDIEDGFRLAHLLLTQPRVEPSALKVWKEESLQEIERRRSDVQARLSDELDRLLSGPDVRFRQLSAPEVKQMRLDDAQRWLDHMVRHSPIEMAVVGDIGRERALELALKYVGSLPPRQGPERAYEDLRGLDIPEGAAGSTVEVETVTPKAVFANGWRGADWASVKDRRILQIAAQLMTVRLREEVREKLGLAYSPYCAARAAQAYPGTGLMAAFLTTDPNKAADMADLALDVMLRFRDGGPTDEELDAVRKQYANSIETQQKEPAYWASVMANMDYCGTRLADVKEALAKYTTYTRQDLLYVMRKYMRKSRRVQVIAVPKPSADGREAPAVQAPEPVAAE
jgi:zinc protease